MLFNCYIHPAVTSCCAGLTQNRSAAFIFLDCHNQEDLKAGTSNGHTLPLLRSACKQQHWASDLLKAAPRAHKHCESGLGAFTCSNSSTRFNSQERVLWKCGWPTCFRDKLPTLGHSHKDLREREKKKKRKGREKTKLLSPHLCGNQTPSLAGFGFIKAETNNSLFEADLPSGLSPAVQIQLGAHILDISSQDRKYYFSSIWMD